MNIVNKPIKAIIQVFAAAVLFGASAPLSKLLLTHIEPIPLAACLYFGSGIGAFILFLFKQGDKEARKSEARLSKADLPWLAGAIMAGGVAAPILLLLGLERTPASTASLLLNFESVATTLIAVLIFREAVDKRITYGVVAITFSSILLTWTGGNWGLSVGALGILGACLFWGLDNNFTRQISDKDPLVIVAIKGLGAGLFSLLLSLLLGKSFPSGWPLILALLVGAISYGISIQLFILALRSLGAARTGALFGIAPFAGTFLSLLILKEVPQLLFWGALPIMVVGSWLMLTEDHQHTHEHESLEHDHSHEHPEGHHEHSHAEMVLNMERKHAHLHSHRKLPHSHPHTPDLHHRHEHKIIKVSKTSKEE
jgi:drug/metabolite transporter (DMT)-like permease